MTEPDSPGPDLDLDAQLVQGTGKALLVVSGIIFLKFGFTLSNLIPPFGEPIVLATTFIAYGTGIGLVLLGVVVGIDVRQHGRHIAYGVLLVGLFWFGVAFLTKTGGEYLGTDGILFTRYSVDLLLAGENPYAHSMHPAFDGYPIDDRFVTYRVDGSTVASISYPALSFLAFVPQALLGVPNLNLTTVVIVAATLVFLVRESPAVLALAPFAILFSDPNLTMFSFGGVFDILWVLPILVAMKYWHRQHYPFAATFTGLAFAVKQTPWFIGPFLAVWLYMEADSYRQFVHRARVCLMYGLTAFLAPNLPFIVWDARGWVEGTLTPIMGSGVSLVKQGVGLTLLSTSGTYALPKSYFTLVLVTILVAGLAVYALYFDQLKWTAWLAPMVVLWANYRSLQNYFVYFVPIAYYAVLLQLDLARTGTPTLAERAILRLQMALPRIRSVSSTSAADRPPAEEVDDV
jgi:uncharacterized membrane protein